MEHADNDTQRITFAHLSPLGDQALDPRPLLCEGEAITVCDKPVPSVHLLSLPTAGRTSPPSPSHINTMSWELRKGHPSQRSPTAGTLPSHPVVPLTQLSQSHTVVATQKLQPNGCTMMAPGTAIATVARQKARYAHFSYKPPPALRRSHLHLSTTANTTDTLGRTPCIDESRRGIGSTAQNSQQSQYTSGEARMASAVGWATCAAVPWNTTTHPWPPSSLPPRERGSPPLEWYQAFAALQERQLQCWQQLTETQQLLTHHVERLRGDLKNVHAFLVDGFGKPSRADGDRRCEASITTSDTATAQQFSRKTSQQNTSLHMVRLLGESTTSTPAFVPDTSAHQEAPQVAKNARKSPLGSRVAEKKDASDDDGAAQSPSTTDAADSEADIFML